MIRIGILGYGNLGRGVHCAIQQNDDMTLAAIFTRRDPKTVQPIIEGTSVYSEKELPLWKDKLDVLILCGGSATDLPEQTARYAELFTLIDSFDTHANIPAHFTQVDEVAKKGSKLSIISCGWDPGLFSLNRLYARSVLPAGNDQTFWGRGVSQGHSDAVRRIQGVIDARQYTVPVTQAVEAARSGEMCELSARQKHTRECYVATEEGADLARIEREIKTMPNYFADYDTTVHFVSLEELKQHHNALPHGGFVIRTGTTSKENSHTIEYRLRLDSNPEFTGSVLLAYARAASRLHTEGQTGCRTVLDIPPAYLSPLSREQLLKEVL